MPRKPKPKNQLSAGQRAALYLEEQKAKLEVGVEAVGESAEITEKPQRVKTQKPKPQHAVVRVDMSARIRKISNLGGMCNGPLSYEGDLSVLFKNMNIPYVRNCGWDTRASKYAFDISRIFKDPDADDSKPENYDFSLTDKYMMGIYNCRAECIYAFGDSDADASWAQKDPDKWARVCAMIVKHYNGYWANGYCFGINKFEISPKGRFSALDNKSLLFAIYEKTARAIKLADPAYIVGGMSFDGYCERSREFLRFCSVKNVPLDFVSFEYFGDSTDDVCNICEKYTSAVMNLGLDHTDIMLSAWNYVKSVSDKIKSGAIIANEGGKYAAECKKLFDAQRGIEGAAFCSSLLLALADFDKVKFAAYYDAQPSLSRFCGISDRYGNPEKPYYAFCAYSQLAECEDGIFAVSEQDPEARHSGVWAKAGVNGNREHIIMISCFDSCQLVDLRLDNIPDDLYEAEIYMSDGVKNTELCDTVRLSGDRKRILLSMSSYGYAIVKIH